MLEVKMPSTMMMAGQRRPAEERIEGRIMGEKSLLMTILKGTKRSKEKVQKKIKEKRVNLVNKIQRTTMIPRKLNLLIETVTTKTPEEEGTMIKEALEEASRETLPTLRTTKIRRDSTREEGRAMTGFLRTRMLSRGRAGCQ